MEIELKFNKTNTSIFLEYFHAEIRNRDSNDFFGFQESKFDKNGNYVSTIPDSLIINDEKIKIVWTIIQNSNEEIQSIHFDLLDTSSKKTKWKDEANRIINKVITSVISQKKETFFHRNYFSYVGPSLDGEYWFKKTRFAPLFPDEPAKMQVYVERILVVDHEIQAIDLQHSIFLAKNRAKQFIHRACLILDVCIEDTQDLTLYWVYDKDDFLRARRGFNDKTKPLSLPRKKELCNLGKYNRNLFDLYHSGLLSCPKEMRRILAAYDNLSTDTKNLFDKCTNLYYLSKIAGKNFPTAQLSYEVAAAEVLFENKEKSFKGFSNFIRENLNEDNDIDDFLDFLYSKIRSAHFHAGEFLFNENNAKSVNITDLSRHNLFDIKQEAHRIIRKSILNWIIKCFKLDTK